MKSSSTNCESQKRLHSKQYVVVGTRLQEAVSLSGPAISLGQSQERLQHEEALETNNGVWWRETLQAVPLALHTAEQLGIKRHTDKVSTLMASDRP